MLTKDTGIIDAVQNHPEILEVFAEYGLGCVGCMASAWLPILKASVRAPLLTASTLKPSSPTATKQSKLQKNKTTAQSHGEKIKAVPAFAGAAFCFYLFFISLMISDTEGCVMLNKSARNTCVKCSSLYRR